MFKVSVMVLWAPSRSRSVLVGMEYGKATHLTVAGKVTEGGGRGQNHTMSFKGVAPVNELPSAVLFFLKIPPPPRRTVGC